MNCTTLTQDLQGATTILSKQDICDTKELAFEMAYTSKTSFVDGDLLPTFGEKPEGWQPSGKNGLSVVCIRLFKGG